MSMDIPRPEMGRKKRIRQILYGVIALVVVLAITLGLSKLKPAAPTVEKGTVWVDTVKRGEMLRDVRGLGTLVPVNIRWIPALSDARVEERLVLPGGPVKKDQVILVLSNPTVEQAAKDAEWQLKGSEAELTNLKAQLANQLADQRSKLAGIRSAYHQAQIQLETQKELFKSGLTPDVILRQAEVSAEELGKQNDIAEKEVETFANSMEAQLAAQEAKVGQLHALLQLKQSQLADLRVRAGIDGVLQELPVQVGQEVTPGTVLARVAQPTNLKAELKIAETQAKDIALNQKATVDTHNGIISGHVMRIDPAVLNGTVTVDVSLEGQMPEGVRPDLSVEGTIEIERLKDVMYVGRPVHGDANSTVGLFKLTGDGSEAERAQVKLGRTSVNTVEILQGLQVGDQVILSDMSAWDNFDRVRLR